MEEIQSVSAEPQPLAEKRKIIRPPLKPPRKERSKKAKKSESDYDILNLFNSSSSIDEEPDESPDVIMEIQKLQGKLLRRAKLYNLSVIREARTESKKNMEQKISDIQSIINDYYNH